MDGKVALPAAAQTLGFELIAVDPAAGTIEVAFSADERFVSPVGVVLSAATADGSCGGDVHTQV